jgi:hypothetical protein
MTLGLPDLPLVLKAAAEPLNRWGEIAPILRIASCSASAFVVAGFTNDRSSKCTCRHRLVCFPVLAWSHVGWPPDGE